MNVLLHRKLPRLLAAVLVLALVGCESSPLSNAHRSPEALARAAIEAVQAGDEDALAALMITREEYETLLWPELPDRNQMPFTFAWSVTGPRSRKARRQALEDFRDIPLELVRVELGDDIERYPSFTLCRDARMWVRRADTGAEGMMPLMDTVVEMEGRWKFMNFVEDVS
jgi:hypothetical protein